MALAWILPRIDTQARKPNSNQRYSQIRNVRQRRLAHHVVGENAERDGANARKRYKQR